MSELPPGPTSAAAIQTARWLGRPVGFLEDCRRRYGDTFTVRFLGFAQPMVVISDPDDLRALYARDHALPPGRTMALMPIMGRRSVLLLEGPAHLERRRLMLPPFHGERMRAYEGQIQTITQANIAGWPLGRPFALLPHMRAIAMEVILAVVFGVGEGVRLERLRRRLPELLDETSSARLRFRVLLAARLHRPDPLEQVASLHADIDELLRAEIASRRAGAPGADASDVLSLLLTAHFEDGSYMSDEELRDQLMTLLLAGHETTATALAWTFDLLLHAPAALARLREELRVGDERYLRAVITESLRLRPVIPLAGRKLTSELCCKRFTLPVGTDVTPGIPLTHTRPDLYSDPHQFKPERFLEDPPATYSWLPFGGGVRRCLGAAFAELEMRTVIATVLAALELSPASARADGIVGRGLTIAPRHGARVRATAVASIERPRATGSVATVG